MECIKEKVHSHGLWLGGSAMNDYANWTYIRACVEFGQNSQKPGQGKVRRVHGCNPYCDSSSVCMSSMLYHLPSTILLDFTRLDIQTRPPGRIIPSIMCILKVINTALTHHSVDNFRKHTLILQVFAIFNTEWTDSNSCCLRFEHLCIIAHDSPCPVNNWAAQSLDWVFAAFL